MVPIVVAHPHIPSNRHFSSLLEIIHNSLPSEDSKARYAAPLLYTPDILHTSQVYMLQAPLGRACLYPGRALGPYQFSSTYPTVSYLVLCTWLETSEGLCLLFDRSTSFRWRRKKLDDLSILPKSHGAVV